MGQGHSSNKKRVDDVEEIAGSPPATPGEHAAHETVGARNASPLEDCSTGCKRDFPNSEADGDASPPAKRGRKPKLIVTQGLSGASDDMHEGPGLPEDVRSNGALTVEQQAELAHVEAVLQAHANAKREALAARQGQERAKEEQAFRAGRGAAIVAGLGLNPPASGKTDTTDGILAAQETVQLEGELQAEAQAVRQGLQEKYRQERAEQEQAVYAAQLAELLAGPSKARPPATESVLQPGVFPCTPQPVRETEAQTGEEEQGLMASKELDTTGEAANPRNSSGTQANSPFEKSAIRGPERGACLGLAAPSNPLCPEPEAEPQGRTAPSVIGAVASAKGVVASLNGAVSSAEGAMTAADGAAAESPTSVRTLGAGGGRGLYGLRSWKTDGGGKAKTSKTDDPSAPSPLGTVTGTTLEYDDVMSRIMPRRARFQIQHGWGSSRAIRVTNRRKPAFTYSAKPKHLSPKTKMDFSQFKGSCTNPPPTWHGSKIVGVTADKMASQLLGMLGWLSRNHKRAVCDVSLRDLVPSPDVAGATRGHEFVTWLREERNAADATLQFVYRALLRLAMYLHHKESKALPGGRKPYDDVPVVAEFRSYSGLLQRKAKKAPKVADEKRKHVAWPNLVGAAKELRAECAGLYTNGGSRPLTAVAKSVQKYLEVALLAQFGDRQRTIRELKVGETLRKRDSRWVICFDEKHKTGQLTGRRPDLPLPDHLSRDMDAYLDMWRKVLNPQQDFVFVSAKGKSLDGSALCHSIRDTIHRLTGQKMNPHMARKSAVTHFREGSTDRELESLALCMGHSVAVQRTVYDLRTPEQKAAPGLKMLSSAFQSVFQGG